LKNDEEMIEKIELTTEDSRKISDIRKKCEEFFDDDAESIITSERYERLETFK